MKKILTAALFAAALASSAFAANAPPAKPPSPQNIELARRVLRAPTGFSEDLDMAMKTLATRKPFSESPKVFLDGAHKAIQKHQRDIAAATEAQVMAYAGNYTEADLRAWLTFLESPLGRSIVAKMNASSMTGGLFVDPKEAAKKDALFTRQEIAARDAFMAGPAKAMQDRTLKVMMASLSGGGNATMGVINDAILNFCRTGADCKDLAFYMQMMGIKP